MIADPQDGVRSSLAVFCVAAGHAVHEAASAREAFALVEAFRADAIITRFYMPEPDGFDLVLHLLERTPRPAILALSEGDRFVSGESMRMVDRLGVDRVLSKPYTEQAVAELLAEVLR